MSSLVKLGAWGGNHGGSEHDLTVAPQRLEGFSVRYGKVIDCISFSYLDKDKALHSVGPWGGAGGVSTETITFGPSEYVKEVHGSLGPIGDFTDVVTSLKFVTNHRTIGPFGHGTGTPFVIPVLNNASIVGFFARAGLYLESIGIYVHPF
ncbi:protein GOS9-like [Oryza brachyantha]|uniref:Jacalin-type lectin domain-containing protein n=1 Tax=Oryza brachyantha TaxID=4533 RepID=J3LPK1_ORYBR|nr:protein GOS9-like [Oryza brachyantha]